MAVGVGGNRSKKKGSGTAIKGGAVILVFLIGIIVYYYYLTNKESARDAEQNAKMTAVQTVLSRDLNIKYPSTPRELITYYSEITKCFYNETYTDAELENLARQARKLYDEELLANNTYIQYMMDLQEDIQYFKNNSLRISSYIVSSSLDVEEFKQDGERFARLYCTYMISSNGQKTSVEEVFILRKDADGHWKILGWDLAENVNLED